MPNVLSRRHNERWSAARERAWRDEPPISARAPTSPAYWPVLEGRRASELFAQDSDPLKALHEGRVGAVVLRRWLPPNDAAQLVGALRASLRKPELRPLSPRAAKQQVLQPGQPGSARWKARGQTLHTLGADMHFSLKHPDSFTSATAHARYAQSYAAIAQQLGLTSAVQALHGGLRELSAGRRVATAVDPSTNTSYSHGVFRMHHPGNTFPVHVDSLWAAGWNARACGTGGRYARNATGRQLHMATHGNRVATLAADALRFRYQFSALLLLQRPTVEAAPDVTLYDPHIEVRARPSMTFHDPP